LVQPYLSSGQLSKDPTRDDPVALKIDSSDLHVNLLSIVAYNHETGEVYARVNAQ
jgi:hypothetical protein